MNRKNFFLINFSILIFSIVIISLYSCSDDNTYNPINDRCDVFAATQLSNLPCSVKYYANATGSMKNVSISYYIDSGKIININPTSFPYEDNLYFTLRDSAKITASGVSSQSGSLTVSFYAWRAGFATFGSDSCVK